MKKYYVLHNPLAGNGNKDESYKTLKLFTENETEFLEITNLSGYKKLFESMRPQDVLVICKRRAVFARKRYFILSYGKRKRFLA